MTSHNTAATDGATALTNTVTPFPDTATDTDRPDLRTIDGISLGRIKYDHERTRTGHKRNRTKGGRSRRDTINLPQINALIATADPDTLRDVIQGMTLSLHRHTPRHRSQHHPGTNHLINVEHEPLTSHIPAGKIDAAEKARLDQLEAAIREAKFDELIADYTQTNNPALRADTAFHVGTLKHIIERDLLLFDFTIRRHRWHAYEADQDLNVINALIGQADADQLRNIIDGITWAIPTTNAHS